MKYDEYPFTEYSVSHLENDVGFMTNIQYMYVGPKSRIAFSKEIYWELVFLYIDFTGEGFFCIILL